MRRSVSWIVLVTLIVGAVWLYGCGATPTPEVKTVEKVVTQLVEKQVTTVVEKEKVVTQVVQQTTIVEKEKQVAVTVTPVVKGPTPTTRQAGGTINVWQPNGWPEQAWHLVSNWESGWAISPMAEMLFFPKPDGTLEPVLGQSISTSADGLKWTLNLRKNVKWTDGQTFKAEDVIYGLLARYSPDNKPQNELRNGRLIVGIQDYVNGKAPDIAGIKAIDDYTIEFTLTGKDATMGSLWFGNIIPLPKHAISSIPFKDLGKDKYWITAPVSTGPYKFVKYVTDQYIEYDKNPDYWDQKPRPDKLFMRISNPQVAIISLQKGDLDYVYPIDLSEVARLKTDPKIDILVAENKGQWFGLERNFYTKDGIWRNPKAIQGFLYGIDRQAYVDSILQGYGTVRNSFYDGTPYACPTMTKYNYDPEKAKALWAEVNMPKDKVISLMSWTGNKLRMDFLPIAQAGIQKLGYKSEVDIIDNSLITDYVEGKGPRGKDWDFHVLLFGPGADPGTPESFVDPKSTSNMGYRTWPESPAANGKKNPGWVYDNPKMTDLFKQGREESDPQKRIAIYQQIDCIWNQEFPAYMFASPSFVLAKSTRLQGLDWPTNASIGLWTSMYKPGDWWLSAK